MVGSTVMTVSDTVFLSVNDRMVVGDRQVASFTQSGSSTVDVGQNLVIATRSSAAGSSYTLQGGTLNIANNLNVRNGSTFGQSSGTTTVGRNVVIRDASDYNQSGGVVSVSRNFTLRDASTATISAGSLSASRNLQFVNSNNSFTQSDGVVQIGGVLDLMVGSGNTYDLAGGRLEVMDSIDLDPANTFIWQSGGTLGVHGSSASIQFNGDLTASSGSILDLNSSTEFLAIGGSLTINDLTIDGYDLNLAAERSPSMVVTGDNLLLSGASITGEANITYSNFSGFDGAVEINPRDIFDPNTEDVYWYEQVGDNVSVYWSLTVPEPSSVCLLALSFGGLLLRRKRDTD